MSRPFRDQKQQGIMPGLKTKTENEVHGGAPHKATSQ